jgi:hypothetical protein
MRRIAVWPAAMLALGLAAGTAWAQVEDYRTQPGQVLGSDYAGSMARQQDEQREAARMQQQNDAMMQRLNDNYAYYAPGGAGHIGGNGAPARRAGPPPPNLWTKPPLPADKNPLLGRWRQGPHRNLAADPLGGGVSAFVNGAMSGGCDSIFGKGTVAFEPDSLQWVAPDGHEEILNHVAYRATGGDVAVLTRDPGAMPAMFVGFVNHDHAVVSFLNCTLVRVGAQRVALTTPTPQPALRGAPPGPGVAAAAGLLDVSVAAGGAPLTNARVWVTRENPAFAFARAGYPVASETAALDTFVANCATPQACLKMLQVIGQIALQTAKTDPGGHVQLQPPAAGRYYVVGFSPYREKAIVWIQPVDFRGGAVVRLDSGNGRPVG